MQSLGWFNRGRVGVLDARAGRREAQTLVSSLKNIGGKSYNMALKHTHKHITQRRPCSTRQEHRVSLQLATADSLTWCLSTELRSRGTFHVWHRWRTFLSSSYDSLPGSWPLSDTNASLATCTTSTEYFTISFTGETTCNYKMCLDHEQSAAQ